MKSIGSKTLVFVLVALFTALSHAQSARVVGVIPFENEGGSRYDWVAQGIEEILYDKLSKMSALSVYEKETLVRILKKQGIKNSASLDAKTAFSVGKATSIEVLYAGDYKVTGEQLSMNVRLYSTYTGSSIFTEKYDGPVKDIFLAFEGIIERGMNTMQIPISPEELEAIKVKPTTSITAFESYCKAYVEIERQSPLEAIAGYFQKALQDDPDFWEAQYNLGIIYYNFQLYPKALQQFNSVIEKNPRFYKPYFGKGVIYFLQNDFRSAVTQLKKSIQLAPKHDRSYYYIGMAYAKLDSLKNAITNLEKSIEINPHYAPAHYRLGHTEMKRGWFKKAIKSLSDATRLDAEFYQANNALGEAYYSLNLFEEAIIEFNKAIKLRPTYATAHFNLGNSIYRRGALEDIVGSFWSLIEVQYLPTSGGTNGSNGHDSPLKGLEELRERSRQNDGQDVLKRMISSYRTALRYDKRFYEASYNLALTYENVGKPDSAEYFFKEALAQKAGLAQAHMRLGKLYEKQRKYEKALAEFKKVVAIEPEYFIASPKLGEAYRYVNVVEVVLNDHQARIERDPRDTEAILVVGKIFLSLKRYGQAEEYYEQLVALSPDDPSAKKTLLAIKKRLRKL